MLVAPAARHHIVEVEHAGRRIIAHADYEFQIGQPGGLEPARLGAGKLRRQRLDHAEIVRCLEADGADQRAAADLVERVFQLGKAIGRVDVDQHEPDARGRELRQQPFPAVGRPDADAVALIHAERQQPGGQRVDRLGQLVPGKALVLLDEHRGVARTTGVGGLGKQRGDGLVQQRLRAVAGDMRAPVQRLDEGVAEPEPVAALVFHRHRAPADWSPSHVLP